MSNKLTDLDTLQRLLPPSISRIDTVQDATSAIAPQLQAVAYQLPLLFLWLRLLKTAEIDPPKVGAPFDDLLETIELQVLDTATLEQLAKQFHVDFREAAENDRQLAGLIVNSIAWHRIKGTPASIKAALELCGFKGISIEEDGTGDLWATYQLGFASVRSIDDIKRIVMVCNEMQPARCRLWRVYTSEFDFRNAIWSDPKTGWSNSYWSDVSGIKDTGIPGQDDDHDLVISLGINNAYQSENFYADDASAGVARTDGMGMQAVYRDAPRWSDCYWGEPFIENHQFIVGELSLFVLGRGEPFEALPKWAMTIISLSRAMGIWSDDDEPWADINCVWGSSCARLWPAETWSDLVWSEGPVAETTYIDEYFIDNRQINTPELSHLVGTGIETLNFYTMQDDCINDSGYTFWSFHYAAQAWNGGYQTVFAERYWSEDEWSGEPIVQTEIFVPRPPIGIANSLCREIQTEQLGHRVHYGFFGSLANHIESTNADNMRSGREDLLASASYSIADDEVEFFYDTEYSDSYWSEGFLKREYVWAGSEYSADGWSNYHQEIEAYKHREPFEMINRYVVAYQAEGGHINVVMQSAQLGAYASFIESVDDALRVTRTELFATSSYEIKPVTVTPVDSIWSEDEYADGFVRRDRVWSGSEYAHTAWADYSTLPEGYHEREDAGACIQSIGAFQTERPVINSGFLVSSSTATVFSKPLHPTHWWGSPEGRRWNHYHGYFNISSTAE